MPKVYPAELKESILRKLLDPSRPSFEVLSGHTGVSKTTLMRWHKALCEQGICMKTNSKPSAHSPQDRLRIVVSAQGLEPSALGALLRTEGLTLEELERWRQQLLAAFDPAPVQDIRALRQELEQSNQDKNTLRKELERKDKALAETAALLVLSKKARQLWGEEEDVPTAGRNVSTSSSSSKKL